MTQHKDGNNGERILSSGYGGPVDAEGSDAAKRILATRFERKNAAASLTPVAKRILAARFGEADGAVEKPSVRLAPAVVTAGKVKPTTSEPSVTSPVPKAVKGPPKLFSIACTGPEGSDSLRALETRFGTLPAQTFAARGGGVLHVFPIATDTVDAALAARGEIAPGLQIQAETGYSPSLALASKASAWLAAVLESRK